MENLTWVPLGSGEGEPVKATIGAYADYFTYDPDGIAGPPTPRNRDFEIQFFGKSVVEMYEKSKETNA